MQLIKTPHVDWIQKRHLFFAFSGALLLGSLASIALRGFNYAIDFTGGTIVQLTYAKDKDLGSLRKDLHAIGHDEAMPQSFAGTNSFGIRLKGEQQLDAQSVETFVTKLQEADPSNAIRVDRKEYVGPTVGRHLKKQAVFALTLALIGIVVYVAFRFTNPLWGLAGLVALFHDVITTAGLFSILGREVDLVIVAAMLAIAGYSINDTIVIFDRMRERLRLYRRETLDQTINASINEMMSRTLMTNGCVIAVDLVLFFFGGPVLHDFATAMLWGGVIGTYSTIAVATPLVYQWTAKNAAPAPAPAGRPNEAARKKAA
jgi:preprotein translocase subunit SecF